MDGGVIRPWIWSIHGEAPAFGERIEPHLGQESLNFPSDRRRRSRRGWTGGVVWAWGVFVPLLETGFPSKLLGRSGVDVLATNPTVPYRLILPNDQEAGPER